MAPALEDALLEALRTGRALAEPLGHKSLSSTVLYTRVDTRALRQALERAHPRERRRRYTLA